MRKNVRCAACLFVAPDKQASNKKWTAYRCKNTESMYYGALLNVDESGREEKRVTWEGCERGKVQNDSVEVCQ